MFSSSDETPERDERTRYTVGGVLCPDIWDTSSSRYRYSSNTGCSLCAVAIRTQQRHTVLNGPQNSRFSAPCKHAAKGNK